MAKLSVTLQPQIDMNAVDHVRDSINKLGSGDEIEITIDSADAHQADPIFDVLDRSGFCYQSKGSHDGKYYHINAKRKLH